jgi:hypothetical protein
MQEAGSGVARCRLSSTAIARLARAASEADAGRCIHA